VASDDSVPSTALSENTARETATGRSRTTKPGYLAVSELAASYAGSLSPFGDDLTLPLPVDDLTYTPTIGQ